jgi:uncharacterized membrane protein
MADDQVIAKIEEQSWIDGIAAPVSKPVSDLLARAPKLAGILHGKWLGHPVHAAVTDIPVGAWATALVLDGICLVTDRRHRRGVARASDLAVAVGLGGAMLAAVFGIADWSRIKSDRAKRVGFLHGALNIVIAGLYGGSLVARRGGARGLGIGLSTFGFAIAGFSAWLGGELSYRHGVGVNRTKAVESEGFGLGSDDSINTGLLGDAGRISYA